MEQTMLQQIMTAPGQIEFRETPIPVPGENQVLIRIEKVGICGSDIHVYHGKHPFTKYPITQGHEVSGEIVQLGSGVRGLSVGQKATIEPQVVCGKCYPCRHGLYNVCEALKVMGFQTTGAASTYFAVDADKVLALPDTLSFDEGAMIEPLAVAVHAIKRLRDVRGMKIAVIGAGPIGILVAQAAKALGASSVLISDISDTRLKKARECNIAHIVNTKHENFGEAIIKAFGEDKADAIFDCAGNDVSIGQAITYARKGSMIVLVAVFDKLAQIDLAVLNDHELDLNTTMMYRHEDYVDAVRLVSEKSVALTPLISRVFPFLSYDEAYRYIDENRDMSMKILIDVQAVE